MMAALAWSAAAQDPETGRGATRIRLALMPSPRGGTDYSPRPVP